MGRKHGSTEHDYHFPFGLLNIICLFSPVVKKPSKRRGKLPAVPAKRAR